MTIMLYNTLTRSRVPLQPLDGKRVRLYTCGPTVYNFAHLGNLRAYLFDDTLKRAITYTGLPVLHVMNITDVGHLTSDADDGEDKMEKGAKREGKTVWEIAAFYTKAFQNDIAKLNILEPDIWCKATDHIAEQIAMIATLEQKGFTYTAGGNVYFDTGKLDDYGKLARLDIESLKAGARVDVDDNKRNPADFVLWFTKSKFGDHAMLWDSPWGKGYPGWHIECSAMSVKYLGEQFDIHCGGIDHIPIHHTNEIAQTEAATGKKPWVSIWLHNEFLILDKGKMAKSGDHFLTLQTVIDRGYDPLVYRYLCLSATYDQQLNFSWEAMDGAKASLESLRSKLRDLHEHKGEGKSTHEEERKHTEAFLDAVQDNLNTPKALAVLWAVLRDDLLANERKLHLAREFDSVFGLKLTAFDKEEIPEEIKRLAHERDTARKEKNWKRSDELRSEINKRGYVIDDRNDGTYTTRRG